MDMRHLGGVVVCTFHNIVMFYFLFFVVDWFVSFINVADEKQAWELPANLAQEVSSVEELLTRGGCDSPNSRLVLQVRTQPPSFFSFVFFCVTD